MELALEEPKKLKNMGQSANQYGVYKILISVDNIIMAFFE